MQRPSMVNEMLAHSVGRWRFDREHKLNAFFFFAIKAASIRKLRNG